MSVKAANQGTPADGITRATREELVALRRQLPRVLTPPLDRLHTQRAGAQAAVMRGRGMDYRESRAYQPGDDVRRLDWRLTARSGRLHTKLFQEERERTLMIVLDRHPGMDFGTRRRFKSAQASRAAAMAAWLAAATGMRVGLQTFGGHDVLQRPVMGTRGALALIRTLSEWPATAMNDASSSLATGLRRIMRLAHGGSQVLLISDGGQLDEKARSALVALRRQAHVRVLVVADVLETALPPSGRYPMAWQGHAQAVDLESEAARRHFRDTLGRGPSHLARLAGELGLRCRRIGTGEETLRPLAELLGIRLGGRQR